jgi:TRAP-type mannitol/chloroaromatic compound transport system substrate-binding protein
MEMYRDTVSIIFAQTTQDHLDAIKNITDGSVRAIEAMASNVHKCHENVTDVVITGRTRPTRAVPYYRPPPLKCNVGSHPHDPRL